MAGEKFTNELTMHNPTSVAGLRLFFALINKHMSIITDRYRNSFFTLLQSDHTVALFRWIFHG